MLERDDLLSTSSALCSAAEAVLIASLAGVSSAEPRVVICGMMNGAKRRIADQERSAGEEVKEGRKDEVGWESDKGKWETLLIL